MRLFRKPRPQPYATDAMDCGHVTIDPDATNPAIGRCADCGATTWTRLHRRSA